MAFEILARLGLNSTGFHSGMKRAESTGAQFASNLKRSLAGAFTVAAASQFVRSTYKAMDALGDLSDQANLTTKDIQEFTAVASKSGLEVSPLLQFIERLKEARREAQSGKEDFRHLFNEMNIDPTRLDVLSDPGDLFRSFAAEFGKFSADAQNDIAQKIGGVRAGGKLTSTISAIGRGEKGGELIAGDREILAASKADQTLNSLTRQSKVLFAKIATNPFLAGLFGGTAAGVGVGSIQKEIDDAIKKKESEVEAGKTFRPLPPSPDKEKKEAEIAAAAEAATPSRFTQDLSALQRIGEQIVGGGGSNIQRDQLTELREIKRGVRELNNGTTVFP